MSGHSKWSNIKNQKETADKKRGKMFGKLSRAISIAAREGGNDPNANAKLRMEIDRARTLNMPKENIERARARGSGTLEGGALEPFLLEAVGPAGSLLLIEGITDNKNRTVSEIKHLLEISGAKTAAEGGVGWAFRRVGFITIDPTKQDKKNDELELVLMDAGADDIEKDDTIEVVVQDPQKLDLVRRACEDRGVAVEDITLGWKPTQPITLSGADEHVFGKLVEALDNHDDIQQIWSN